jgi:hydrogenase maturation protease
MLKTLIVGYGNADREDDGAAWHVLSGVSLRLGRPVPNLPDDGFFPEDEEIDLWYVLQLAPEMAEDFARYQRIIFVDAHTGNIPHEILLQPVDDSPPSSSFTHHMTPAACMAITRTIYHHSPQAMLLSVRGYNFGFSRSLSEGTAALVQQAVEMIWVLLGTG